MSHLHLNSKEIDWWRSVWTESTDSMWMKSYLTMTPRTIHSALQSPGWSPIHCSDIYLGWKYTSTVICSLQKLAWYNSRNIKKDKISELWCIWTSFSVKEIPGSKSCSWAMITLAMSHHLTPQNAMLRIHSIIILYDQKLWICDEATSSI